MKLEELQRFAKAVQIVVTKAPERWKYVFPLAEKLVAEEPSVLKGVRGGKRKIEPLLVHVQAALDQIIAEIEKNPKETEKPVKEKKSGRSGDGTGE